MGWKAPVILGSKYSDSALSLCCSIWNVLMKNVESGVSQFLCPVKQMSGTCHEPWVLRPATAAASSELDLDQVSEDSEAVQSSW
jgi:hypothetical protein